MGEDIFSRILQEIFMSRKIFASCLEAFSKCPSKEMKIDQHDAINNTSLSPPSDPSYLI